MAVFSMSHSNGITGPRLAVIFLIICTVFFTKDYWLPSSHLPSWASTGIPSTESATDAGLSWKPQPIPDVRPTPIQSSHVEHEPLPAQDVAEVPTPRPSSRPVAELAGQHDICESAPPADNIMVVLKTGATEIYQKLPTHFLTILKCTPHWLIWSDLEQTFGDYYIHDAIMPVSGKYKDEHEDFELYRQQQDYKREGEDIGKLSGDKGWNLDKWKFMPMFIKSFEMSPENIDWFVYIEADTSLSWVNLLLWLKRMDPKDEFFLGAQNVIGDTTFGHGGSGIVVSRAAAKKLADFREKKGRQEYDEQWEEVTSRSCCGDEVIARAFLEADVPLTHAWPRLQGEKISNVDWTDTHWCAPSMTWHHVTAGDLDSLWQFGSEWVHNHGWDTPYLYRDLYAIYIERQIASNRTGWNNLSQDRKLISPSVGHDKEIKSWSSYKDWEQKATESFDSCAEACQIESKHCVQWMWSPGRCYLSEQIRLGKIDDRKEDDRHEDEEETWTSGWRHERIEEMIKAREPCKDINWGPTKPLL